jgi:hypothetical protein
MSGHRLAGARARILIPIVSPAVAKQDAGSLFQLPNQVDAFHAI